MEHHAWDKTGADTGAAARAALTLLALLLSAAPTLAQTSQRCFKETGQCISGRIRAYWEHNGGLPVFGLPLGPQQELTIEGKPIQAQWFERNRLELHPENARPYDVLLGRLGADVLARQGRDWFTFAKADPIQNGDAENCRWFQETQHTVCGEFLQAYRLHGLDLGAPGNSDTESLALFGLPISQPMTETLEGKPYQVQWFERARFELHPELRSTVRILFGRLGAEFIGQAGGAPGQTPGVQVKTESGTVQGAVAGDIISFKGVPYAAPPVGKLRWRAPQPVAPWAGVLDASAFKKDCMQVASALSPTGGFSEDCLYLNIWRPAAASDKPVPVVVWIPGGGLVRGGASLYPFDNFARKGVAVVTVSYRLGRFGFFAHPALAKEAPNDPRGNYGFMDQIAALKWVKANIAAFGGDPNNVTLAGESAGGGSVLVQLTSPLSRGLFQRAIAQSPGTPSARAGVGAMSDLASAETIAVEWAQAQGINGDDAAALAALRALPVEVLTAGTDPDSVILGIFGGPRVPGVANAIIDGRLIVDPPEVAFPKGEWARVPVIVGANDADLAVTAAKNKDELFASFGPRAAEVRALYDPNGDATLATLIQTALADRNMVEPSRNLADLTVKAGQPAYFFRFSYVPEVQRGKVPGATHGAEIAFAFDVVSAALGNKASAADLAMAEKMSAYWLAFMKTGNPNGAGRPQWSTYDPATRDVLNFTNEGVKFGADPLKERLDLWKSVWEQNK